MKRDITVLLTGAGAPGAPGIVNCYRNNGERRIRIVGVDANENASGKGLTDAFYVVPKASSADFIPEILSICKQESVDIVVPIVTRELENFALNKVQFMRAGIKISVLDAETLHIVNDKGNLLDAIKAQKIDTARYKIVNTDQELFRAIHEIGYPDSPVCIKATMGNGSRGVRIIDPKGNGYERFFNEKPNSSYTSYETVFEALNGREIPRMMVMECLPGSEYSVDVLSTESEIIAMVCRKGTRVVSSIQVESVIENNTVVLDLCRAVTGKLKIVGEFGFDIKCDCMEKPYIIEINPRLTAGIVACAAAGCNIPYFELLRQMDEPIPNYEIKYGVVMTRHWQEEFFGASGEKIDWLG